MKKRAALHNLGCKVNAYETEAMRQLLEEAGYEIVPFAPGADVYVINTCTVTNIADRKSRQMLHRARKMNPGAVVVAAGCYVQAADLDPETDAAVDIVLGNNCKGEIVEALRSFEAARGCEENGAGCRESGAGSAEESEETCGKKTGYAGKIDINHTKEFEVLSLSSVEGHTRACLKVQDGCNQFCSYCIIPYARGRVRSRAVEEVVREARALAESGCREIVLTGIHLSSYGSDFGGTLLGLIRALHEEEGIERIRLGSLEPGIITEEFAAELAALPKLCPHFHLSLQSGCDTVLRRMNRRYTAQEYAQKCGLLRRSFQDPAITTDVIVGFPGETQEEFDQTAAFLREIALYETHIFKYSRRKGTRAAAMPEQVPEQTKSVRSELLIALGEENRSAFERRHLGRETEVLFEERRSAGGRDYFTGYTREYIRAAVPADQDYSNVLLKGRLGPGPEPHLYLLER